MNHLVFQHSWRILCQKVRWLTHPPSLSRLSAFLFKSSAMCGRLPHHASSIILIISCLLALFFAWAWILITFFSSFQLGLCWPSGNDRWCNKSVSPMSLKPDAGIESSFAVSVDQAKREKEKNDAIYKPHLSRHAWLNHSDHGTPVIILDHWPPQQVRQGWQLFMLQLLAPMDQEAKAGTAVPTLITLREGYTQTMWGVRSFLSCLLMNDHMFLCNPAQSHRQGGYGGQDLLGQGRDHVVCLCYF